MGTTPSSNIRVKVFRVKKKKNMADGENPHLPYHMFTMLIPNAIRNVQLEHNSNSGHAG